MRYYAFALMTCAVFLSADTALATEPVTSESVICLQSDVTTGKVEKYALSFSSSAPGDSALLFLKRSPKGEAEEGVLARNLECVRAKSDFRVVNCQRPTVDGSARLSDATLTIIKHSYLSAGPIKNRKERLQDSLTENYRLYFRDDREPSKELSRNFLLAQCYEAGAKDVEWIKGVLSK